MDHNALKNLQFRLPSHPNVLGKTRYLNAAVLIPLVLQQGEYHFLFQKRAAHIRQGGEISFPGGEFEPGSDQSCRQAALRETEEELGITQDKIHILGRLDTLVSARGVTVDSFVATLDIFSIQDLCPDVNEVERLFMLPVSWFEQNRPQEYELELEIKPWCVNRKGQRIHPLPVDSLGLPARYKHPWPGLAHRILVYQTPEAVVWGLTAELVHALLCLLQDCGSVQT